MTERSIISGMEQSMAKTSSSVGGALIFATSVAGKYAGNIGRVTTGA